MLQVILSLCVMLFLYSYKSSEVEDNAEFYKFQTRALLVGHFIYQKGRHGKI